MFRSTMLAAVAAAGLSLCSAASAQQEVQLYGLLDMSAGSFQNAGSDRVARAASGSMSTSFIGFKGNETIGGNLKAVFAIEHFLRLDTGSAGRFDGDAFWARNAYVGLSGDFGTTTLGRNTTPLFVSTLLFNAFGDSFGFSPSIRQLFTPSMLPFFGDTGWNNSIAYASHDEGGWSFNLLANLGEGAPGAQGKNLGANVLYFAGPLGATLAWQRVENGAFGAPPGWRRQTTWQLGASYELAMAKLFGQYADVRTDATTGTRTALWGIGAAVPLGSGRVLAQYGDAVAHVPGASPSNGTLSLGYDLALSKRTDVYAVYMHDRLSGQDSGNSVAAGLRLRY